MAKKRGRKPGGENKERIQNIVRPSHCDKCGSTDRSAYRGIAREQKVSVTIDGVFYNWIQWKRTQCLNPECKQYRMDRIYLNRSDVAD